MTGVVRQHNVLGLGMPVQEAIDVARRVLAAEGYQSVAAGPTAATFVRAVRPQWVTIAAFAAAVPTLGISLFALLVRTQEQCTVTGVTSRKGTGLNVTGMLTEDLVQDLEEALRNARQSPGQNQGQDHDRGQNRDQNRGADLLGSDRYRQGRDPRASTTPATGDSYDPFPSPGRESRRSLSSAPPKTPPTPIPPAPGSPAPSSPIPGFPVSGFPAPSPPAPTSPRRGVTPPPLPPPPPTLLPPGPQPSGRQQSGRQQSGPHQSDPQPFSPQPAGGQSEQSEPVSATQPPQPPLRRARRVATEQDLDRTIARPPAPIAPPEPEPPVDDEPRWVLVLDDGREIDVPDFALIGRDPEPSAEDPEAGLVSMIDPEMSVSKTHAAFGVDDEGLWFLDRFSTNGTSMKPPGQERVGLEPGVATTVPAGSEVWVGRRHLQIDYLTGPADDSGPPAYGSDASRRPGHA